MKVLGCDPGPTESALVAWNGSGVELVRICPNEDIIRYLRLWSGDPLVIEKIAAMGMTVGASVFETCYWSGRFAEAYDPSGQTVHRITRGEVKMHLCGSMRAKDANIRQALIDKCGPVGKKSQPGPLWGISSHAWSALAVAVTFMNDANSTVEAGNP